MNIQQALQQAQQQLHDAGVESARIDTEILLAHLLNKDRSYLFAWSDKRLDPLQLEQFNQYIARRMQHEPVAYIQGKRDFWSFTLKVNQHTLIPRSDTERLVELALDKLPTHVQKPRILDLGTGSGAIAAAIASESSHSQIIATDSSKHALQQAQVNFQSLGLDIQCLLSHWFQNIPSCQPFHLILSNPPYICEQDPHLQQGDLLHEPQSALVSGKDGLNDLRHIIYHAPLYLLKDGYLLLEHGYNQAQDVSRLMNQRGFKNIVSERDMAGQDRVTLGQWQG